MKYLLGGKEFSSKKAVKEFMSPILVPAGVGNRITEPHHGVIADLILMHPRALEKLGPGCSHFEVMRNRYGKFCICVVRVDGTSIDFSYYKCLDGETFKSLVIGAARNAVAEDIICYKTEHFSGVCEVTGELLDFSTAHVDHAPPWPFYKILNKWLGAVGLTYNDIETKDADDGIGRVFASKSVGDSFRAFHKSVMNLRIVGAKENLSMGAHRGEIL